MKTSNFIESAIVNNVNQVIDRVSAPDVAFGIACAALAGYGIRYRAGADHIIHWHYESYGCCLSGSIQK
jgi:hypothetical protein